MKKRFIEWDMPLAEISGESSREKNIRHGHPSTLHIWWARRPLASSRATNFAALVDLPDNAEKRKEITELIKKIIPWDAVKDGNNDYIKMAQQMIKDQWGDHPPRVLDPFSGGGAIPLEALRLGCETYVNDYNPVAVFIEKATLEWPQKFGVMIPHPDRKPGIDGEIEKVNFLAYMIDKWAKIILERVKEEIGNFYPEEPDGSTPVAYIWAKTIPCQNPSCKAEIPLIKQFWLSKKDKKNIAYKYVINSDKKIEFEIIKSEHDEFDPSESTVSRADARCLVCGQITNANLTRQLFKNGKMSERLIAVVLQHPKRNEKIFRIATEKDLDDFSKAKKYLDEKVKNWPWLDNPIPKEEAPPAGHRSCSNAIYGLDTWDKFYNPRQMLALITFVDKIKASYEEIKENCRSLEIGKLGFDHEGAAKAIIGYLGIIQSRCSDFCNTFSSWLTNWQFCSHIFTRQSIAMNWDYSELNILSRMTGTWQGNLRKIPDAIVKQSYIHHSGIINSPTSASSLSFPDNFFDAILTDPPYYDNVHYADLSDFFYVWLKRSIGDLFPDIFATPLTPKSSEIIACQHRHESADAAKLFFESALSDSFKEIHRILKPGGIVVIVYAHKTTSGWETMLNSLVNAGLAVTSSWPIHTEMKTRLVARTTASLASSIYMVCRKIEREKVGFISELQPKIKERIETKLQQFWNEGIAGGDFFISAIGPGMEIFSQYERVEKLSGEQVTTAELLDYIRSVSTDFIVEKLLKDASSTKIDSESEFYLAYRWTHLDNTVEYDDARKLASASGVSLEELWGPGGFVKKSGSNISVLGPKERGEVDSIRSMVDVMHKCLLSWEKGKKDDLAELLAKTGFADSPAFKQFCQAVAESLLNGNKEKQLLEGFLIGIDNYKRAEVKVSKAQTDLKQYGVR